MTVNQNQHRNALESNENQTNTGVSLRFISVSLHSAIQDYGQRRSAEVEIPEIYDVYEELADLTGLGESTIRSYTNRHQPKFPPVDKLLLICKTIHDRKPFDAYIRLGNDILGEIA